MTRRAIGAAMCAAALASACAPRPVVPVKDLSRPAAQVEVFRIVRPGDTLYSVSWAAGVDYRELAAWNGIAPPYVIRPGERLSLVPTGRKPATASPPAPAITRALPASDSTSAAPIAPATAPSATAPRGMDRKVTAAPSAWTWPVSGKIIGGFGKGQGLDIAVKSGTPVRAAAAGEVVYAGSGLRGYGQLVIVKHSSEYLSAYGHNRKMLVEEGDAIVSGQVIAESGSAPGQGEQVHFEIRRNGRPVDPLALLPSPS